jgi:type 1 glutamine amidotransferase
MERRALIVRGGWDGHDPIRVADLFAALLEERGLAVAVADSLAAFDDAEALRGLALIVPLWTMGQIGREQCANVLAAVEAGVGLAGCHGGMCDAFRENVDWQFMTGGQWVAHPGGDGVEYTVEPKPGPSPIVAGLPAFAVKTEHYYLHVDPAVEVLATTRFPLVDGPHAANGPVDMPVAWTKRWGAGRVFYCALGHQAAVFDVPEARELMRRGLAWAARTDF